MGKKEFPRLYRKACKALGTKKGSIKISNFCDTYDPKKNYAGIILYHHNGRFRWRNTKGVAKGYNCQSFYVHIQCTDNWTPDAFSRAGQGFVHDKMYQDMFGQSYKEKMTCCGGFAILKGVVKYSSTWLNNQSSDATASLQWKSDGNKQMSTGEKKIVKFAIDTWKQRGANKVAIVPDSVHESLAPTVTATPPTFAKIPLESIVIRGGHF